MPPAGFEPKVSAGEWPQTYALCHVIVPKFKVTCSVLRSYFGNLLSHTPCPTLYTSVSGRLAPLVHTLGPR